MTIVYTAWKWQSRDLNVLYYTVLERYKDPIYMHLLYTCTHLHRNSHFYTYQAILPAYARTDPAASWLSLTPAGVGLPDLANKNNGCPVKFEFQVNNFKYAPCNI